MAATRFADIRTEIPGPRSRAMVAAEREFLAPGTQALSQLAGIAVDHGKGALLCDVDGNTFVDFVAGICVASLGHGHPALGEALGQQAARVAAGSFTSEPRLQLLERLAKMTPYPALKRTQVHGKHFQCDHAHPHGSVRADPLVSLERDEALGARASVRKCSAPGRAPAPCRRSRFIFGRIVHWS